MPELPEVETIARGLSRRLVGEVIDQVHLSRGDIVHGAAAPLCAALRGRRVRRIARIGKQIVIDTTTARAGEKGLRAGARGRRRGQENAFTIRVHLGMTGRLVVVDRDHPVEPHTHLRVSFRRRRIELRFCDPRRFGGLWLIDETAPGDEHRLGRRLPPTGPDPLEMPLSQWRSTLNRRRQIKALLLDQSLLGGVGNIYCDEALHRAGIHPLTSAADLDDPAVRRLRQVLRRVLSEAIAAGGSSISDYRTADNMPGMFQHHHRVYDRAGEPCRRCRTPIVRLTVAGRGTYICPHCQQKSGAGRKRTVRV